MYETNLNLNHAQDETLHVADAGQRGGGMAGDRWCIGRCYYATRPDGTWRILGWTSETVRYADQTEVVIPEHSVDGMPEPWNSEIGRRLPDEEHGWRLVEER